MPECLGNLQKRGPGEVAAEDLGVEAAERGRRLFHDRSAACCLPND